ncbi:MAG: hypothetical protein ABIQ44_15865 [Chloroflexia bacterium]
MTSSMQAASRNASLATQHSTITNLSIGALVGVISNEEFSKGGRNFKFSPNAWISFRPIAPRFEFETAR